MKLTNLKLLSLSLIVISAQTFAEEKKINYSGHFSVLDFSNNKTDSISGLAVMAPSINGEASAKYDDTTEGFASIGVRLAFKEKSKQDEGNALLGLNAKYGVRAKIGEHFKLGVGAAYSYNITGPDNFHDVSIFNQSRLTFDKKKYVQLELSKSITDEKGYGVNFSAGQNF